MILPAPTTSFRSAARLACLAMAGGLPLMASAAPPPRPVEALSAKLEPNRKVVYKTDATGKKLHLHLFEPPGYDPEKDRRAVFLIVHGGGWTGGDARKFYVIAEHLTRKGMVGICPEYRLVDAFRGTTVFDCVKDGRSAVRYLRAHASELGIDPNRIVMSGGSAGGHVAAGAALFSGPDMDEPGEDRAISCRPDALVLLNPVIDTSPKGYGHAKIGERWRELSPVDQVRPNGPPTILFHSTKDTVTPYSGAKRFHEKMLAAGNDCELITHEGGRHGYFLFDVKIYDQLVRQMEGFLERHGFLSP